MLKLICLRNFNTFSILGVVDSLNNGKNINKIISKKDMTLKEIVSS
nr:ALPV-342 [Albatrosspox virus]